MSEYWVWWGKPFHIKVKVLLCGVTTFIFIVKVLLRGVTTFIFILVDNGTMCLRVITARTKNS